jgi:nucleoid DNA-binding protein
MTVTKTQLAEAYSEALNKGLGDEWNTQFSRRDANKLMDLLWPVVAEMALKDTKKSAPGSVPLGQLGRLKMAYKEATKARKGTNPFTGEPTTFKAKPATVQPRFSASKTLKDDAAKYMKKAMKKAA